MTIIVEDYKWTQTDDKIIITIPLHGINSKHVNILTHKTFIKVSFRPFLLNIFLLKPIVEDESRCKILESEVKLYLKKEEQIEWDNLQVKPPENSIERVRDLENIMEEVQIKNQEADKVQNERKEQKRRKEIDKEIERENVERRKFDEIKNSECLKMTKQVDEIRNKSVEIKWKFDEKKPKQFIKQRQPILPLTQSIETVPNHPIRKCQSITVSFSERSFPTPQRESQIAAEQEWILKQHEARKAIGFDEADLSADERNPDWLKDKASEFFQKENFIGAISALTCAVRLAPKRYDLYLHRAEAQIKIENFKRCIEDSSAAYELLVPPVPSNLKMRIQCLHLRGLALFHIGHLNGAHSEISAALNLEPNNKELQKCLDKIEDKLDEN